MLTISPTSKKKNIFGLNTISKFTEAIHDYKFKKNDKKEKNMQINLNNIKNSSLKNKIKTNRKNQFK